MYWNQEKNKWDNKGISEVKETANSLYFTVIHLTDFAGAQG